MHTHNGPFLSAAAIRRALALHPFSEGNRSYLMEEAARREGWEREVKALLADLPALPEPAARKPLSPSDGADSGAASFYPLQAAPPY